MEPEEVLSAIQVTAYGNCLRITKDSIGYPSGHIQLHKNPVRLKKKTGSATVAEKAFIAAFLRNAAGNIDERNRSLMDIDIIPFFIGNPKIFQHCKRVSGLCGSIAKEMGFSPDSVSEIKVAGLMHDIGKADIGETILNKAGKLDEDEWRQIRRHPEIGSKMLSGLPGFSRITEFVLQHHEKWDGSGYPKGESKLNIAVEARIIAVADAYDAMTSDRPYKDAVSAEQALAEIRSHAGTQFDPEVVEAFLDKVLNSGFGKAAESNLIYAV